MKTHSYGIIPVTKTADGAWRVLLVQHREGHWSFPKGTPEPGETPIDTARREFTEETGILEVRMNPDVSFTEEYSFRHLNGTMVNKIDKKVTYFLGVVNAPHTTAWNAHDEEVVNGALMDFDEAEKTITFKEARAVLAEVKSHLDKQG